MAGVRDGQPTRQRLFDVHTHVVPTGLPFGQDDDPRWPTLVGDGPQRTVVVAGAAFRTVQAPTWDTTARRETIDSGPVDGHVLSPMPELFCYWADPRAAVAHCRMVNEWLAQAVHASDGAFEAFGIVPLQSPEHAAAMLGEIVELGLRGIEVGTAVEGTPIFDPTYEPVLAEAAALDLAVFVHSFRPPRMGSFASRRAANAVCFPLEIGFALGGLTTEGTLARLPALRLCASHGGGAFPTLVPRIAAMRERDRTLGEVLPEPVATYASRIFYDSLTFGEDALALLRATVGATQVVAGSDYPFFPKLDEGSPGVGHLLGDADGRWQLADNARRLLGLA
jgi:aminocarboxymuconate-semialdehyde decarboxylase